MSYVTCVILYGPKSLTGKNFDELIVGHIGNALTGKDFVQITGLKSNLSKFSLVKLLCNDLSCF